MSSWACPERKRFLYERLPTARTQFAREQRSDDVPYIIDNREGSPSLATALQLILAQRVGNGNKVAGTLCRDYHAPTCEETPGSGNESAPASPAPRKP